jgi:hypothetical protein
MASNSLNSMAQPSLSSFTQMAAFFGLPSELFRSILELLLTGWPVVVEGILKIVD